MITGYKTTACAAFVLALVAVVAAAAPTAATKSESSSRIAKERLELANEANRVVQQLIQQNEIGRADEQSFRWSLRLMEAETDASKDQPERVAAVQRHLDRMKRMEEWLAAAFEQGEANSLDVFDVKWWRLDAERLVAGLAEVPAVRD